MNVQKYTSIPFIGIILGLTLLGCDDDTASPESLNFFPLNPGQEWTYQRWIGNEDQGQIFDTLSFQIGDEVNIDGLTYIQLLGNDDVVTKLVRQDGSKFYGRQHELYSTDYTHEYLFLDTSKNEGESWSYAKNDAYTKTEYIVTGKNTTRTVNGVVYKNVIEIQVNYYTEPTPGDEQIWLSAQHWYAAGAGEIYSFYPYPVSMFYGDISSYIIH